jgi:hypothetical protein
VVVGGSVSVERDFMQNNRGFAWSYGYFFVY